MLRRLVLTTAGSLAALTAAAPSVSALQFPPLPLLSTQDSLTVTVSKSGVRAADGTFTLECGTKSGGNHPAAEAACERLRTLAGRGEDPFKRVGKDQMCTQQFGGSAVARVTGTWRGRDVDARFTRGNGCEIDRWENLEPVLPRVRG